VRPSPLLGELGGTTAGTRRGERGRAWARECARAVRGALQIIQIVSCSLSRSIQIHRNLRRAMREGRGSLRRSA
jgi:hypothetical protein